MFKNIKAVIFDMDGTMIDSMWLWKSIDIDYLGKYNIPLPDDLQEAIEGMSFSETAHYFKRRFELADSIETIKDEWNQMASDYYHHSVPLKASFIEFLDMLKHNNIKIGIGTSNSKELVDVILNKYQLTDSFDSVRTSCEVEKGKPFPDIFLKVAQDLEVDPSECLVFEDVPNGLLAAKRAGMIAIAVEDDFSAHLRDEKRELSDFYIEHFSQAILALSKGNEE